MSDGQVLEIVTNAMLLASKLAGPLLITALALGVLISLIQTVTQIQEMTLTFVPKAVGMMIVLVVAGNWMLGEATAFTRQLWSAIPGYAGG
ncbi:MAG: flagellar biosynthetic protein FliQ [Nitriliruptoraceae bacterium]|nr:flagellar biosynthetic protein FliQ [Nitriliruptoraceae bacterium]